MVEWLKYPKGDGYYWVFYKPHGALELVRIYSQLGSRYVSYLGTDWDDNLTKLKDRLWLYVEEPEEPEL